MTHTNRSQFKPVGTRIATTAFLLITPSLVALNVNHAAYAQILPAAKEVEATGTYAVEKAHSDVSFTVRHLGLTKVPGHFTDFDGKVIVDGKKVSESSVEFAIKVASVSTGDPKRDGHLQTPDFFDAAKYPEITFKSIKINKHKDNYEALGKLTMHGVTKDILLPFSLTGPIQGMDKKPHLGVEIELGLKRSDYGIAAYPGVVGDDVKVNIDLDLVKQ